MRPFLLPFTHVIINNYQMYLLAYRLHFPFWLHAYHFTPAQSQQRPNPLEVHGIVMENGVLSRSSVFSHFIGMNFSHF